MGNCESTTAGSRGTTLLGGSGGGGSRLTGYPSPNTAADAIIKEEPDFVETHCSWVGCDRDLHSQEQLVKVLLLVLPTKVVRVESDFLHDPFIQKFLLK